MVIVGLISVTSLSSLIYFICNAEAQTFGDNVKLTVPRDGQVQEMNVMVGSRPYLLLSSTTTSSSSLTSDILTYQNNSYGIRIQYPANWTKDEEDDDPNDNITNIVAFSSPLENTSDAYPVTLAISMERLADQNMTLNEIANLSVTGYNKILMDFNLIELNPNITLGGVNNNPAYGLIYTDREDNINYKTMEIGTIIGNKVYYIEYFAEEKNSNYVPTIKMMINSLEIK